MSNFSYKIKNSFKNLRRNNREHFIENIQGKKHHTTAILSLHFNNFENIKRLLEYLKIEKNQNFDIVLIENSTKEEEKEKLVEYTKIFKNSTLITTIKNLWSAGGYGLGMEYILAQGYEYFFMIEDDIILLQEQTFSSLLSFADEKTLTFINNCKNTRVSSNPADKGKSRRVQIAGYPTEIMERVWIIDPRHFFRTEDLDRGWRIEVGIKKYAYQIKIIDHDYIHPYLKPVNNNAMRFYFSIRNQLFSFLKNSKKNRQLFIVLFFYLRTALDRILIERNSQILVSFSLAIRDFLQNKFSFQNNQQIIQKSITKKTEKNQEMRTTLEEFSQITKNLYSNQFFLTLTGTDIEKIHASHKIDDFFKHWVLTSANATILYPLFILAPKIVCINEFNLQTGEIQYIYISIIILLYAIFGDIWVVF